MANIEEDPLTQITRKSSWYLPQIISNALCSKWIFCLQEANENAKISPFLNETPLGFQKQAKKAPTIITNFNH
ncbi:MAG: hypothetical protein RIM83_16470 [Allomuricauda sp.]|jgi:hypothetical protein